MRHVFLHRRLPKGKDPFRVNVERFISWGRGLVVVHHVAVFDDKVPPFPRLCLATPWQLVHQATLLYFHVAVRCSDRFFHKLGHWAAVGRGERRG